MSRPARRVSPGAGLLELFGVVTGAGPDGVRYVDAGRWPPAGGAAPAAAIGGRAHQPAHRQRRRGRGHGVPGLPGTRSFGEPMAGAPTGNAQHRLPDGAELYLTEGIGADRTGRTHGSRLRPDQPVATDWTRGATSDAPVLEAATGWLAGRCGRRS